MSFTSSLKFGKVGESRIAQLLMARGWTILPVYEQEMGAGKGPVLYTAAHSLIAPDMLAYKGATVKWIEAKTKSGFTWHRNTNRWVTGIDLRHYEDYLKVRESSPWDIWLMFLHLYSEGSKDTPGNHVGKSPIGLFGEEILKLSKKENHRSTNWGKSGMVYWSSDSLKKITSQEEMEKFPASWTQSVIPPSATEKFTSNVSSTIQAW